MINPKICAHRCLINPEILIVCRVTSGDKFLGHITFNKALQVRGHAKRVVILELSYVIDLLSGDFENEGRYHNVKDPVATKWLRLV